ncbi:dockerin type I domain-containing protein [Mucisphaera calidilacus]|uniref:EF-hand domain-containing protein n=1 Tax=Mucisphaera calidilacus TaxID=2527982 RepID=A0A518BUX6_9BACT|nr:dockerin type I domain-containing protein [Mucisphaera calidilacus]QDU70769.1 hypothetical protein Pan265_06050 [Mucisphaera calidilacus]
MNTQRLATACVLVLSTGSIALAQQVAYSVNVVGVQESKYEADTSSILSVPFEAAELNLDNILARDETDQGEFFTVNATLGILRTPDGQFFYSNPFPLSFGLIGKQPGDTFGSWPIHIEPFQATIETDDELTYQLQVPLDHPPIGEYTVWPDPTESFRLTLSSFTTDFDVDVVVASVSTGLGRATIQWHHGPLHQPMAADFNRDANVNLLDLSILAANFNPPRREPGDQLTIGKTFEQGDANGDGFVDLLDLSVLASTFGNSVPGLTGGSRGSVPEPASALLLTLGLACLRRQG